MGLAGMWSINSLTILVDQTQNLRVGNRFSIFEKRFLSISPLSGLNTGLNISVKSLFEMDVITFRFFKSYILHLKVVSFRSGSNFLKKEKSSSLEKDSLSLNSFLTCSVIQFFANFCPVFNFKDNKKSKQMTINWESGKCWVQLLAGIMACKEKNFPDNLCLLDCWSNQNRHRCRFCGSDSHQKFTPVRVSVGINQDKKSRVKRVILVWNPQNCMKMFWCQMWTPGEWANLELTCHLAGKTGHRTTIRLFSSLDCHRCPF